MTEQGATRSGSFADALQALRQAQKPAIGTAAYSRHINRPLGRLVAAAVSTVGMSPNLASVISGLMSGSAIALIAIARPSVWVGLLIGVLLVAGYVMDSVDGQLARLQGGGSKAGEWLDHTIDCVKTLTLHLAVAISWYRFPVYDAEWWLLIPLGFAVVAAVSYFGLILMPTLRPSGGSSTLRRSNLEPVWRRYALLPMDYGTLCVAFVLFNGQPPFVWIYVALAAANALALLAALRKWWRELRLLDGVGQSQ
jgi:phosphatidylglycerophosphate synthase